MSREISHVLFAAFLASLLGSSSSIGHGAEKPNVVLVITDDQGYGDLSCHGNPTLKTPNIDELFREAVRLTDYHVAPDLFADSFRIADGALDKSNRCLAYDHGAIAASRKRDHDRASL